MRHPAHMRRLHANHVTKDYRCKGRQVCVYFQLTAKTFNAVAKYEAPRLCHTGTHIDTQVRTQVKAGVLSSTSVSYHNGILEGNPRKRRVLLLPLLLGLNPQSNRAWSCPSFCLQRFASAVATPIRPCQLPRCLELPGSRVPT